jgi:hypothetical protein
MAAYKNQLNKVPSKLFGQNKREWRRVNIYDILFPSLLKNLYFSAKKAQNLSRLGKMFTDGPYLILEELRIKVIVYSTVSKNKVVVMHISFFH